MVHLFHGFTLHFFWTGKKAFSMYYQMMKVYMQVCLLIWGFEQAAVYHKNIAFLGVNLFIFVDPIHILLYPIII